LRFTGRPLLDRKLQALGRTLRLARKVFYMAREKRGIPRDEALSCEPRLWAHPKTHAKVKEILSKLPRGKFLDIAAGEGALSAALSEMGFEVSACDLQPDMFKAPGIECAKCNLNETLPFTDKSFDCAVCVETIEHLRNRYAFLAECSRVLRPGGTLVLTTPNVLNLAARAEYLASGFFPLFGRPVNEFEPHPTHTHINPIPYYYLRHAFVANKFEITRVTTDRYRKSALLLTWLYPLAVLASMHSVRKETYPRQREANRRILRTMRSAALLFGRTLIVVAKRIKD
jgi:2-polyprenyl-3-methyl-5-hydroxy-6-metoxy-1,4-benzoquinol methylase